MIDTLIYDLSEVLIYGLKGVEYTLAKMLDESAEDVLNAMLGEPFRMIMRGQISEIDYLGGVLERTGWPISLADMQHLIRENMLQRIPGSIDLLAELSARYPLFLVSDHATEWVKAILPRHSFLSLFQERFWSCDMGSIKRDPETFPFVLERIGRSAERCFFIDDNPKNVVAAARCGIEGMVFEDAESLRSALAEKGIL